MSMYNQKLVCSIKVNGKILREFKETVYIKFGSEYAISLKNLNTVRAIVNVFIDGDNIVPGGLVLNAGQSVDLERSIKNNNLTEGAKLKFIERTGNIEQHRGIKLEDGVVRVEYQFEVACPVIQVNDTFWKDESWKKNIVGGPYTGGAYYRDLMTKTIGTSGAVSSTMNVNGALRSVDYSKGETMKAQASSAINDYCLSNNISTSSGTVHDGMATMDWNDAGITVEGSKSTQKFSTVTVGQLEDQKHTIVLKLLGETPNNVPVLESVTVKTKQECPTCGAKNNAQSKFCSECGTGLTIY